MRIAWIGQKYFMDRLPECGLAPVFIPLDAPAALDWADVAARFGGEPELVVYADRSFPPPLCGVEGFPCPTVFLCVDSHIHSWYPAYAQGFDLCSVSLRDHLPRFALRLSEERLLWLPPFARDEDLPRETGKVWDLLFVGTVNPETTPFRARFLDEVRALFPGLHVTSGSYRDLFPQARVVLNIAERGDLNYRVFEALGCGSCLVTPEVGNGQAELFTDGEDLFTYPQEDAAALVTLVRRLLADEGLRTRAAASGNAKVEAAHRMRHRAGAFARWLGSFDLGALAAQRLAQREAIRAAYTRHIYLHWAEVLDDPQMKRRYLAAGAGR